MAETEEDTSPKTSGEETASTEGTPQAPPKEEAIQQNTNTYILKILSGPHIGAEIPLNIGSYTIGKSDDCDVILKDEFISDKHLTLTLTNTAIKLSDIEENTSLSGTYIEEKETDVHLFDVIGIGSTFFTLGAPDHEWPTLEIPKKVSYKHQAKKEAPPSEEASTDAASDEASNTPREVKVDQNASELKKRYASTLNFFSKQTKTTQIGIAVTASVGFVLILILVFYLLISALTTTKTLTPNQEINLATEVLKDLNLDKKLQIVGPVDGIIIIKGYVKDDKIKNTLKTALNDKKIPNQLNLYSVDKILSSVKNVLESKNVQLNVEPLENGVIMLEGIVDSRAQLQNVVKAIQTDVPGVQNVQSSVFVREELYASLEKILNDFALSQIITLSVRQTDLIAQGVLSKDEKPQWESAKNEIENLLPKDFKLIDQTTIAKIGVSTDILKAQLWGVNLAETPYIVFTDGTRYYIGDNISEDLTITDINKKGISLMYKKNKLFYDYNDKVQWIVE